MFLRRFLVWMVSIGIIGVVVCEAADASRSTNASDSPSQPAISRNRVSDQEAGSEGSSGREVPRFGIVQKALIQLYHIARAQARAFGEDVAAGGGSSPPPTQPSPSDNRIGLQHMDAIRHSVSSVPIGDDIRGRVPQGNDPKAARDSDGERSERVNSESAYLVSPYYYEHYRRSGPRLSTKRRQWTDYRYYGGQPSRYGRGRYSRGVGRVPDDSIAGEYFRFGFMQGYDAGHFDATGHKRTERVLAHASMHLSRGLDLFHAGRYREAASTFKLAAETNQGDPTARIYAAHAFFTIGRYKDAVVMLRRAFELEPDIVYLMYDMRDDYGRRGDFDAHLKALESAHRSFPRNLDRLIMLGYVRCYSHLRDTAYDVLAKAHKIAREDRLVTRLLECAQPPDVVLDEINAAERTPGR